MPYFVLMLQRYNQNKCVTRVSKYSVSKINKRYMKNNYKDLCSCFHCQISMNRYAQGNKHKHTKFKILSIGGELFVPIKLLKKMPITNRQKG